MKTLLILMLCSLTGLVAEAQQSMNQFIDDLMSRMTLDEKIGQLNQLPGDDVNTGNPLQTNIGQELLKGHVGSVLNVQGVKKIRELQRIAVEQTRLGIPLLVGLDVIHGYETLFPIPLGMASTWDIDGIKESAHIAAKEAGANGIAWTFSPMVDIANDARWGRQAESAGEDPFLGSCIARAMVTGYQGKLNSPDEIMACVKHFALYGAAESGRDYNTVDMSRVRMYNQYFAPYQAAVDAGVMSVMTSFNVIDGIPASANRWLLTDVLRKQWAFGGFVVTDYGTIGEMQTQGHSIADVKTASALSLRAGVDMDMCSRGFLNTLHQAFSEGTVSIQQIEQACRRVLEAKYKLGLFADPYKYCDVKRSEALTYCREHREKARQLTAKSFVLLRNKDHVLPLSTRKTIALIGPLAGNTEDIAGTWSFSAKPSQYRSLFTALKEKVGSRGHVLYTQGCNVMDDAYLQRVVSEGHGLVPVPRVDEKQARDEALRIAADADVIICAMGETAWMSGEGTSRTDIRIPAPQRRLLKELTSLSKPVVLLNFAGRATELSWESEHVDAIMNVWYGSECADALCDVLFGEVSPSGRLTVSMPKHIAQCPLYYNQLNTGRPVADTDPYRVFSSNYIETTNGPLYTFGFGLTYTSFTYSQVKLSSDTMRKDGKVTASVEVKNTGSYDADEVVQLYIRDLEASISRPVMELKGFHRIHIPAGETRKVEFVISPELLMYDRPKFLPDGSYSLDTMEKVIEAGDFHIMIGANSKQVSTATLHVN